MNRERLTYLIDILSAVPPERFDIETWKCETAACALGWACGSPHFQEQGLHFRPVPNFEGACEPEFEGVHRYYAGARFFGITIEQSEYLFCPNLYIDDEHRTDDGEFDYSYVTPEHVITRIKELLA